MAISKLTAQQKVRLGKLEPQLRKAAVEGDLRLAKLLVTDLQDLLRPTGHETRLMQLKNWLYEAAINAEEYTYAIAGLQGVRAKVKNNTRVHLEASALLAIAFLRKNDFANAESIIGEVLKNDKVITSQKKREAFRRSIIERFDEEVTLFSLKGIGNEKLDLEELQTIAIKQAQHSSEVDLYNLIGYAIPENVKRSLFRIDDFAKKQLPNSERLKLPSPAETIREDKVGKTLFGSIKRTIYKSLCDPLSDIYKAWFTGGMKLVLNKAYITTSVISTLTGFGIGIKAIAASVIALIIKFGIEVYCEHYKPDGVMELR